MKRVFQNKARCLAALLTLAAAVITFAPAETQGQVTAGNTYTFVSAATVTNVQTLNVTSNAVYVPRGRGIDIYPNYVGTNSTTANIIAAIRLAGDGTNWANQNTIKLTNTLNSTTAVRGHFRLTPDQVDGQWVSVLSVTTEHTNSAVITDITGYY